MRREREPDPAVSVLLPFYGAEATLPSALRSLRRQSLVEWECVLVDDGSTDAGCEVARRAAAGDPRFRVVSLRHGGLVAALNAGVAHCRAPLVARMDADDVMHRERLALQVQALRYEPALVAIGCHVRIFPRRGMTDGLRAYESWLNAIDGPAAVRREAFVECPLAHPTLMFRRDLLARFGYCDRGWPEDYDLLLRLLGAGCRVGVVARRLLGWRDSPARLTRTGSAYRLERLTACKAWYLAERLLSSGERYLLWGYGSAGRSLRRALMAHGKRPAYVIDIHPGRIGHRIGDAPVVHPDVLMRLPRLPLVASVAGAGPRREIRDFLAARGFLEGRDFVCAA
jgi:glycosyltransferase involved in cell wall biosynthesis